MKFLTFQSLFLILICSICANHCPGQDSSRWVYVEAGYPLSSSDHSPVWLSPNLIWEEHWGIIKPREIQIQLKPLKNPALIVGGLSTHILNSYPQADSTVFIRSSISYGGLVGFEFRKKNFFLIPAIHFAKRKGFEHIRIQDKPYSYSEEIMIQKALNAWGAGAGIQGSWLFFKPFILSTSLRYIH